jgi:hypothetical protein
MARFLVLDQNVLQRLKGPLPALLPMKSVQFVLIDTALVELVKPANWQITMRAGFHLISAIPRRCHMSISVEEAVRWEMTNAQPARKMLLPAAFTKLLRQFIVFSQEPNLSADIEAKIIAVRNDLLQNDLNAEAAKEEVTRWVNFLKDNLPAVDQAICKSTALGRGARVVIAHRMGRSAYFAYAQKSGLTYSQAARMRRQHCLTWRWISLRIHHALQWLGDGGIEGANPDTVLRDVLDQDYVLLGSSFDGVLSKEVGVNEAFEDLRWLTAPRKTVWTGRSRPRRGSGGRSIRR